MNPKIVGLLHPGNMGVTIGAAAAKTTRVIWASERRSEATHARARQAELEDAGRLADLVAASEVILAVCPPHGALELAQSVAGHHFTGIYVDANAVSPATVDRICETVVRGGASFVDGGIIGPPVRREGTTRLYLSGTRAPEVATFFRGSMVEARVIGAEPGAASALKVAYAAWTKCTDALVLAIRTLAALKGVDKALLEEWTLSQPELAGKSTRAARDAAPKAWRYVGEMQEIASVFKAAGLPSGFHLAAADVFDRLARFKDVTNPPPELEAVVAAIGAAGTEHQREP